MIPFLRPNVPTLDECLPYLSQIDATGIYSNYGPLNSRFENRMLDEVFEGSGSLLTVSNATVGLALALRFLGLQGRRYVIMPSFTFAATPLAARWAGFEPYFVDVDEDSWLASYDSIQRALHILGDEVAAVMPYATFGNNFPLDFYTALHQSGVPVVIDAAASLGSISNGSQFGKDFVGAVVYSMHATKPFGVGEGGLVYSHSSDLIAQLRRAGNFAFGPERAAMADGFNTKLPEILAAVALAALDNFSGNVLERVRLGNLYADAFSSLIPDGWKQQTWNGSVVHQFMPALAPAARTGSEVIGALSDAGVQARQYFSPPCHQQPAFRECGGQDLSVTDEISKRIISLPLWEGLPDRKILEIVSLLDSGI